MALQVKRVDVWTGELDDRPGALAEKLSALAAAKVNLDFVLARRAPEAPGKAVIFLAPIAGAAPAQAATAAGLHKPDDLFAVRVEGADRPGIAAAMSKAAAEAGINMRGLSALAISGRFAALFALDSAADADKVADVLKALD